MICLGCFHRWYCTSKNSRGRRACPQCRCVSTVSSLPDFGNSEAFMSELEMRIGHKLSAEEEEFVFRAGREEQETRTAWWICNRCGLQLIDGKMRHDCRRVAKRSPTQRIPGIGEGNDYFGNHT